MPLHARVASGVAYGAIGGAASALVAPYLVSAAGGAQNLTDGQRAVIAGMSTLLGGVTAGLAGQNAQAGATAAENEVLNNSLGDHRSEEQKDEDELKKEMSQVDSKLTGGKVIIGYDEADEPEYVVKPPASLFAGGGATGNSQGASGNTAPAGGGSAFDVDVGNSVTPTYSLVQLRAWGSFAEMRHERNEHHFLFDPAKYRRFSERRWIVFLGGGSTRTCPSNKQSRSTGGRIVSFCSILMQVTAQRSKICCASIRLGSQFGMQSCQPVLTYSWT